MPLGMGPLGWYVFPYIAFLMGRGYPFWSYPYFPSPWFLTEKEERDFLEGQAEFLEQQLTQIRQRLEELKKREKEKK